MLLIVIVLPEIGPAKQIAIKAPIPNANGILNEESTC